MRDLFGEADAPALPGLASRAEFVTVGEEQALIAAIGSVELTPFQFGAFEGKRLTRSFGWRYSFTDRSFSHAEPLPEWLLPIAARAADFAGLQPEAFGHALLIRYDPGAGIGWHMDRPVFEQVVGVSLGAPVTMAFRQRDGARFRRVKMKLEPRLAYHLSGEVRWNWEHGITSHEHTRWSLTFRSLSDLGRRQLKSRPSET